MFCPLCKAEYRDRYLRCSACDVDLVPSLDFAQDSTLHSAQTDSPELLWKGSDPNAFARIRAALEDQGLEYTDEKFNGRLLYPSMDSPFEIWTRSSDHTAVEDVLDAVLRPDKAPAEASQAIEERASESPEPRSLLRIGDNLMGIKAAKPWKHDTEAPRVEVASLPSGIVEDFYAEDAVAPVWRGEANGMAELLRDCLRENSIGAVITVADGSAELRVLPETEARAREIVREVVEGTPPD